MRPKRELVRLVREADGVVDVDRCQRAPGRGAYVCIDPSCIGRGLKGGRLAHAFRQPSRIAPDAMVIGQAPGCPVQGR